MTGVHISMGLIVVETISILCLIFMSVDRDKKRAPSFVLRVGYIGMTIGLGVHVIGHIDLVKDYHPPRSWSWVVLQISVNWTIWTVYLSEAIPRWRGKA